MNVSFIICSILLLLLLPLLPLLSLSIARDSKRSSDERGQIGVALRLTNNTVIIENGIVELTLSNPGGILTGLKYNGNDDNLLDLQNKDPPLNGGFWDLNWSPEGSNKTRGEFDRIEGTSFKVIVESEEQVEVSFTRKWDPSVKDKQSPLFIDKRFIVLRNVSGFYSYAIFEHHDDMPGFYLNTARIAFMLNKEKFEYMVVGDKRQRYMPQAADRLPPRGQALEYPEAVLLVDPVEPQFKGEVDDKYQYTLENKDNRVHGWISFDPPVGFWQIAPSSEYRTGGPFKQDLTSHVNPTTLAIFMTSHYAGMDLIVKFKTGEVWKKLLGPVFIYLNSPSAGQKPQSLWDNAKQQLEKEEAAWPYAFPASNDFPASDQRGTVKGRMLVNDRYVNKEYIPAGKGTFVGLAKPGDVGSWQRENKGYQFWTATDDQGNFVIKNVRAGDYNLYASIPGFIGDYRYDHIITIPDRPSISDLGAVVYEPTRDGATLWEIGVPDRSAAEFYVPDPNPKYINKLYVNHTDKFRQYGLWERYAELYPNKDLVYTVGVSDYKKDWFFAHVNRKIGDKMYKETTWQIKFKVENLDEAGNYKLRLAFASAHNANLEVRINNEEEGAEALFSTGTIGGDNAIARHGIHGIYWLFNVTVPGIKLVKGDNTIFLTQTRNTSPFQGIMYDYIRFEAPPLPASYT